MEAYMKLVAEDYLSGTLGDFVKNVLEADENCEVSGFDCTSFCSDWLVIVENDQITVSLYSWSENYDCKMNENMH